MKRVKSKTAGEEPRRRMLLLIFTLIYKREFIGLEGLSMINPRNVDKVMFWPNGIVAMGKVTDNNWF